MEALEIADGHGAEGVAVVGILEIREALAFGAADVVPVLEGNLQRGFDGAGAIGREEHVAVGGGHQPGDSRGEFGRARMR